MFGFKTAPAIFQQTITEIFGEYIPAFMQVFLDYFDVYGTQREHLGHLRLCLERCCTSRLSLNPAKCAFGVTSGALLSHITSKEALSRFLGQIRWHSRMLRYLFVLAPVPSASMHSGRRQGRCYSWPSSISAEIG